MLRLILAFLLAVHGLIHLLGFVREWSLSPITALSGQTIVPLSAGKARAVGLLWLVACLLLSVSALLLGLERTEWWLIAGAGLGLSQALVILYWKDAKAGTLLNIILFAGCIAWFNLPIAG